MKSATLKNALLIFVTSIVGTWAGATEIPKAFLCTANGYLENRIELAQVAVPTADNHVTLSFRGQAGLLSQLTENLDAESEQKNSVSVTYEVSTEKQTAEILEALRYRHGGPDGISAVPRLSEILKPLRPLLEYVGEATSQDVLFLRATEENGPFDSIALVMRNGKISQLLHTSHYIYGMNSKADPARLLGASRLVSNCH